MAHPNTPQTGRRGLRPLLTAAAVAVIIASTAVVGSSLNLWPSVGAQERTADQQTADDAQGDESARQQAQGVAGGAQANADAQRRAQAAAKPGDKPANPRVAQTGSTATKSAACSQCGTIETIREVKVPTGQQSGGDQHNILGNVAGGVAGGVIGNQFGGGSGRDALTVVGAVGGALAGREIQRNMRTQETVSRYQTNVRMQDGTLRTVTTNTVQFASGDYVRFVDGRMVAR